MHRASWTLALSAVCAVACTAGPECRPGSCAGCCDANGLCQAGASSSSCGTAGNDCNVCVSPQVCREARCVVLELRGGGTGGGAPSGGGTAGGDVTSGGNAGGGSSGGGTTTLLAPMNVRVTAVSGRSITLSWDAVPGADHYRVAGDQGSGGAFTLYQRVIGANQPRTFDTPGLTPVRTYRFQVLARAFLNGQLVDGPRSATVTETTLFAEPADPTFPRLSSEGIDLAWPAVAQASGYAVLRATDCSQPFTQLAVTTQTTYRDTTAAFSTPYRYQLAVVDAQGRPGDRSFSCDIAMRPAPAPTMVSANRTGTGVVVGWRRVADAYGATVEVGPSATGPFSQAASTVNTSTATQSTLISSAVSPLFVRVTSRNCGSTGAWCTGLSSAAIMVP